MSLLSKAPMIGEIGLEVAEVCAPQAKVAAKAMVEEALGYIFKKPLPLSEALPQLSEVLTGTNAGEITDYLPKIARIAGLDTRIAERNITRLLGTGANDIALATDSNTALKIGLGGPIPRPIHNPLFDAPVLEHGRMELSVRYYVQPLGNTAQVTDKHVVSVIKNIRTAGYLEEDIWNIPGTRKDQVALFGKANQPFLIDQGSALPRYGTMFKEGQLVPHPEQQYNLAELKEYLAENHIALVPRSTSRPLNPLMMGDRSFTKVMSDGQLSNSVKDYFSMTGRAPTLQRYWTHEEVRRALNTLAIQ